ncbi:MAG: hypothetical protein ACHQQR_10725 [Gemmatimonadales bacterium]
MTKPKRDWYDPPEGLTLTPVAARMVIVPVYWEIRFPCSQPTHTARFEPRGPTRFTRIVGNVETYGVELASLRVGSTEQLATPPLDLCFLPASGTFPLMLETATPARPVVLDVIVQRCVAARRLLIGPMYDGEHRLYRLGDPSDEYVIMIEGVEAR